MHRFFVAGIALAALLMPTPATHAAGWNTYRNTLMRFSVRLPAGWRAYGTGPTAASLRSGSLSINVQILPVPSAGTIRQTVSEVARADQTYSRIRWSSARLGGRAALAGVDSPPTEGGVSVSDAIYIASYRRRVYSVQLFFQHKPPARRLGQFPALYRVILGTWKFT